MATKNKSESKSNSFVTKKNKSNDRLLNGGVVSKDAGVYKTAATKNKTAAMKKNKSNDCLLDGGVDTKDAGVFKTTVTKNKTVSKNKVWTLSYPTNRAILLPYSGINLIIHCGVLP